MLSRKQDWHLQHIDDPDAWQRGAMASKKARHGLSAHAYWLNKAPQILWLG